MRSRLQVDHLRRRFRFERQRLLQTLDRAGRHVALLGQGVTEAPQQAVPCEAGIVEQRLQQTVRLGKLAGLAQEAERRQRQRSALGGLGDAVERGAQQLAGERLIVKVPRLPRQRQHRGSLLLRHEPLRRLPHQRNPPILRL